VTVAAWVRMTRRAVDHFSPKFTGICDGNLRTCLATHLLIWSASSSVLGIFLFEMRKMLGGAMPRKARMQERTVALGVGPQHSQLRGRSISRPMGCRVRYQRVKEVSVAGKTRKEPSVRKITSFQASRNGHLRKSDQMLLRKGVRASRMRVGSSRRGGVAHDSGEHMDECNCVYRQAGLGMRAKLPTKRTTSARFQSGGTGLTPEDWISPFACVRENVACSTIRGKPLQMRG